MSNLFLTTFQKFPSKLYCLRTYLTLPPKKSESFHAICQLIDAFAEQFKTTFTIEGAAFVNIAEAVNEIKTFSSRLSDELCNNLWVSSALGTDFGYAVTNATLYSTIADRLYDHLIKMYSLKLENKKKDKHLTEIQMVALEDLTNREELLLPVSAHVLFIHTTKFFRKMNAHMKKPFIH